MRVWSSCGGERGQAAVSELFKRILSLKDHYDQKAWIFHAVIERMVESGQWDHATELLESAIRRGDVSNPVSYVFFVFVSSIFVRKINYVPHPQLHG